MAGGSLADEVSSLDYLIRSRAAEARSTGNLGLCLIIFIKDLRVAEVLDD